MFTVPPETYAAAEALAVFVAVAALIVLHGVAHGDLVTPRRRQRRRFVRRNGGLWFWRVGRLGGSVYIARR